MPPKADAPSPPRTRAPDDRHPASGTAATGLDDPEGAPAAVDEAFRARRVETALDRLTRRQAGRRSTTRTTTRRGRYVRALPADGRWDDIAFDASIRAAALRTGPLASGRLRLAVDDLHRKERVRRAGNLILFLVDASWSMATAERIAAAKGAVVSLLLDAYQRRDRVGLAVFRRREATVVLPFTNSVTRAQQLLGNIAVGGKTPLSHALHTAARLFERERRRDPSARPLLVLLTDGGGNISLTGRAPAEEMRDLAGVLRRRGVRSLVIDLHRERAGALLASPARELAEALGGTLVGLAELRADGVAARVKAELRPLEPPAGS